MKSYCHPQILLGARIPGYTTICTSAAYTRGKKHLDALRTAIGNKSKADLDNGLVAHYLQCHEGEEPRFKMDVVEKFERPMQRQIAEEVAIHHSMDTIVMNSKN